MRSRSQSYVLKMTGGTLASELTASKCSTKGGYENDAGGDVHHFIITDLLSLS